MVVVGGDGDCQSAEGDGGCGISELEMLRWMWVRRTIFVTIGRLNKTQIYE